MPSDIYFSDQYNLFLVYNLNFLFNDADRIETMWSR
jgi:hypothetical protein